MSHRRAARLDSLAAGEAPDLLEHELCRHLPDQSPGDGD